VFVNHFSGVSQRETTNVFSEPMSMLKSEDSKLFRSGEKTNTFGHSNTFLLRIKQGGGLCWSSDVSVRPTAAARHDI
jgi:hypothetical protein